MADVLAALARANVALAAAVLLTWWLRRPIRRLAGAKAAYALWSLPLAAALATLLPHPAAPAALAPVAAVAEAAFEAVPSTPPQGPTWSLLLTAGWLIGMAGAATLLAVRQAAFMAALGRVGPAVVGAIRPRIVTPDDFEQRFAPAEREVILAHEAQHLAAQDARINALAAALQCICWFNPLVHLGVRLMRIDQELACDAAVLERFPAARRLYGELLLKTQLAAQPLPLGCHWPAGAEHPLKERIAMLKSPLPSRGRRAAGLTIVALTGAAAATAAWAAQPGARGLEPDEAQRLTRPGQEVECKPDANRELHDCHVVATRWAKIATAADVAAAYPGSAQAAGLTADVFLQCGVDRASGTLSRCAARKVYADRPLPAGAETAFAAAAVKVAGIYRLKPDAKMPDPMFMTIQFRPHPAMPGAPVTGPLPKRAPPDLPMPAPAAKLSQTGSPPDAAQPEVAKTLWAAGERPAGATAEPVITKPDWVRRPVPADVMAAYPPDALRNGLQGGAVIACEVSATGLLEKCQVTREEPEGAGFGQAALAMSGAFQMKPATRDGQAVAGGQVRIPVRFLIPISK
jgi:TonB family protein